MNCCEYSSSSSCFPATAKVKLVNGKTVEMSKLRIGDQVQTGINHYSGRSRISQIREGVPTPESGQKPIITARKRSLGQANIFAPVCHSVHRGVCLSACWETSLQGRPPFQGTPCQRDPLPERPPAKETFPQAHTSGGIEGDQVQAHTQGGY